MGYQLWTSPITGYRRRGTRLSELRELLDGGITAHAILELLQSCPADADAVEVAKSLGVKEFDFAGVQFQEDGPVAGFVLRSELKNGTVQDHIQQLTEEHLIADSTPLAGLFTVLNKRESVFVLIGPDVKGIVTRADLNKPAVRIYLFSLISLLEMHLAFWIQIEYQNDAWKDNLSKNRLKKAEDLQSKKRSRNQGTRFEDCLQFCDKRDLVLGCQKLLKYLGLENTDECYELLIQAEDLRNLLAHSQQDVIEGTSWENLFKLVEWIENFLHRSDDLVEQEACRAANKSDDESRVIV